MKSYNSLFIITLNLTILFTILNTNNATDNQVTNLDKLLKSKKSRNNPSLASSWATLPAHIKAGQTVHVSPQNGLKEADMITSLPGQPASIDFNQYAGYVSLGSASEKALFYYFAESPHNSSSKPLVLWLNGGPGCSSLGNGGLLELGPFRVKSDGKTLYRNPYSWNNVANVIFLESPAGVGFSYGNASTVYEQTGDISTAKDAYIFLINWLERFPEYKTRDFYLTGESYAGHYVPQLAYTILENNKHTNLTHINLKGIAIGNAWIDDIANTAGMFDFYWGHAMFSDEAHTDILKYCNFSDATTSQDCYDAMDTAGDEIGAIDIYHIYAPVCLDTGHHQEAYILDSVELYDPCASNYVETYLNSEEVQKALHVKHTKWASCSGFDWQDSPDSVLPVIRKLMASNISVWIYSGDVDGRIPFTSSKYSINTLKLPIKSTWRPWYTDSQVGGYVVGYDGLVFVTVRGAGHLVPSYQPERALTLVSSFLQGILPPKA